MAQSNGALPTWTAARAARPALHEAVERLARLAALDGVAEPVAAGVRERVGSGAVKDALSGTWLGHALHPLLTDVPIGTWTSAILLDALGGEESAPAAERLIAIGLAATLPTVASGWSDWADTTKTDWRVRRVGLVHALANATAATLYATSLVARRRGHRRAGRRLALVGAAALGLGGHLGGYLSYSRGVGVDQTAFEERPEDWTDVLAADELGERAVGHASAGGVGILLTRQGGRVFALADRCVHRGGPLHEGRVNLGQVTCPWHGSTFWLQDGSVAGGPATCPQPAYDVRVRDGRIEVRAPSMA